jgi:DNA polymerase elongation subunit (family B)
MDQIEFNAVSWYSEDIMIHENENSEEYNKNDYNTFIIYIFGRLENGKSITVKVLNYKPCFHIRIPSNWKSLDCDKAMQYFKSICPKYKKEIHSANVDRHHDLHQNFCANKSYKFMTFQFDTMKAWDEFSKIFNTTHSISTISTKERFTFNTYEKKVDPIISFIHTQELASADWNILANDYEYLVTDDVTTDYFVSIDYKNVIEYTGEPKSLAPLKTLSYDIECVSEDGTFPQADRPGDMIVSICGTINVYGSETIVRTDVLALNSSKRIKNCNMECFAEQKDLLLAWKKTIQDIDPDFITGFNIFDFDNKYIHVKSEQPGINCQKRISYISRLRNHKCEFKKQNISSAGLGDNEMFLYNIPGREYFDTMKLIQQDHKLTEYTLSKCAEHFMKSKVTTELIDKQYKVFCNTDEVQVNNYVKFEVNEFMIEEKVQILEVYDDHIIIPNDVELTLECKMCLAKDDMGPQELFDSFPIGPGERRRIHQYCIQDCALVNKLAHRLDFVTQRMALANVSSVPFNYIILRGQGIKALSLFARECKKYKYLIRDLKPNKDVAANGGKMGYEGALVLDPKRGFYETPIVTLDFNSLYPSVEIAWDMSHETYVTDPEFMNLPDYHYRTLEFDEVKDKEKTGKILVTTFATAKTNINPDTKSQIQGKSGIVGTILSNLLSARKIAKKNMKKFPLKRQIYDGQQKALKVTANSIYGQLGSGVSPISCVPIAAATTCGGRELLTLAKDHMEQEFKHISMKLYNAWLIDDIATVNTILDKELEDRDNDEFIASMKETFFEVFKEHTINPIVAYGDTDSNFNNLRLKNKKTKLMPKNYWARCMCMKLGHIAEKLIKIRLPYPNNMAFEKVIQPLSLMEKKNYLGYRYEDNPDEYDFMIMGFKLKRRDSSIVFQKVVGKSIAISLKDCDAKIGLEFLKQALTDIIDGKYKVHDFVTSRLLKAKYKGYKITTDNDYVINDESESVEDINEKIKNITKELSLDVPGQKIKTGSPEFRKRVIEIQMEGDGENFQQKLFRAGALGEWHWYDVIGAPAHVTLCQRMRARDPGNSPQMNTRIPYAYIVKDNSKGMLLGERIEHPDYIITHNIKIDYLYYITNQIKNPATQFFELINNDVHDIFTNIIGEENKHNEEMFTKIAKNETKKLFSGYGFRFDSDTEDENDAISKIINKCKNTYIKKKVAKKVSVRSNITSNKKSITNSIITDNISVDKRFTEGW